MAKRSFLCLTMVLVAIFMLSVPADAATIKNKTGQRLVISLTGGRTISLAGGSTANITNADVSSPNVQTLIQKGKIEVLTTSSGNSNKPAPRSTGKERY